MQKISFRCVCKNLKHKICGRILTQFTGLLRTNTVAATLNLLAERTGLGKSVSVSLRKNGPKFGTPKVRNNAAILADCTTIIAQRGYRPQARLLGESCWPKKWGATWEMYGNREIVVKWTVGVWEHTDSLAVDSGRKFEQSLEPNTNAQRMSLLSHLLCSIRAHLGTTVTASRVVSNKESQCPWLEKYTPMSRCLFMYTQHSLVHIPTL